MSKPFALVTNALEFAGPPAITALRAAGFGIVAHDPAFSTREARQDFATACPGATALAAQRPYEIVEETWAAAGRLDALISNDVHPPIHGKIEDADIADLRATIERLVVFPFALAKAAIPRLKTNTGSRVVFITSSRTRLPLAEGSIPDAARAAANALVKSLSLELAPYGIPVNAIAPNYLYSEAYFPRAAFIDDPGGRAYIREVVPAGRLARPEEIGELICHLATMRSSFLTGSIIDFTGGWPAAPKRPSSDTSS